MLMNEHNELVALECVSCHRRLGLNLPWVITINEAGHLGDLIRAVERSLKMKYYPRGVESADHPMEMVLRAFTNEDSSLFPSDGDIREAYVWCSGFTEHWIRVDGLLTALDNLDGKHGEDQPIAIIE
jgi:hypothetical protein